MTHVVILGGGPAGVGAAWKLRQEGKAEVTVLERGVHLGGNAGSFKWREHVVDYGSHRLHPASAPFLLEDIQTLLGDDLLDRPRHGRIHLRGKWVHFPLKPVDLLLHLDKRFTLGALWDAGRKLLPSGTPDQENFATVLQANLGKTICRDFYFPYAVKLWGHDPRELSSIQAYKRVSAGSFGKLVKKVLSVVPGMKKPGAGRFFYPRKGFGQITEAYAQAACERGAKIHLETNVTRLVPPASSGAPWQVTYEHADTTHTLDADHVWSTIPITTLARLHGASAPQDALDAASAIDYRAMLLIYLDVPVEQFTEYDAHYFPGSDVAITRLSEPKNYAVRHEPRGRTVLCAELPCARGDAYWGSTDEELGRLVAKDLATVKIPLPEPPLAVHVARLPQAYPIYRTGYEHALAALDTWATQQERLLSYGRQGLFAHDNTHHALFMAYAAAECLQLDGTFDGARWADYREVFAKHVVED